MSEYKNAYFVPSHRTVEDENLEGFISEVYFANRTRDAGIPFILLDDTDNDINRQKVRSLKRRFREVDCFVLNKLHIKGIYDEISRSLEKGQREIFSALYPDSRVNYGNTLNKMFVLSAVLGCESFHRRDSDILMDTSEKTLQKLYPIEVELDYLGKKIDNKAVYIVGSGYKGVRNIDFGEIIGNSPVLYKEYLDCLNMPEKYQKEKIESFLESTDEPFTRDCIMLNGSPECGNISFYKIFEYIPCSPAPFTIGTDYFTKEMVNQADLVLICHKRNVIHRHTKCRYDTEEKVYNYVKGIASFVDTMFFYSDFFPHMKEEMIRNQCFERRLTELCDTLIEYYDYKICLTGQDMSARRQSFQRFIRLVRRSKNKYFKKAAARLMLEGGEIFDHTNSLLRKHAELINSWPHIIKAAKAIRNEAKVQRILMDSRVI